MSGLSARTNSCGGEGARCFLGGDSILGAVPGCGAFEKNLRIPSFFFNCRSVSTSEGTSDRSEESAELMVVVLLYEVGFRVVHLGMKSEGLYRQRVGDEDCHWI